MFLHLHFLLTDRPGVPTSPFGLMGKLGVPFKFPFVLMDRPDVFVFPLRFKDRPDGFLNPIAFSG